MTAQQRLNSDERKEAIIRAATPIFAEKGFKGTTTREIAEAAGVSEALLYRHFPSKEAMYSEIRLSCCAQDETIIDYLGRMPASTTSLVVAIYFMISGIITGRNADLTDHKTLKRLMLHSLSEDGAFARQFLKMKVEQWLPSLEKLMAAAAQSGDLIQTDSSSIHRLWFCHHLGAAIAFMCLPQRPAIDYPGDERVLVREAVRFALRGLGLTDSAITKHYAPETLELMVSSAFSPQVNERLPQKTP